MREVVNNILKALEASDGTQAAKLFAEEVTRGGDAWEIHLSFFPLVQRVLNPPFINPHLPKMYRIYRELVPYLKKDETPMFVRLELNEYARRPKLGNLPKAKLLTSTASFSDVESAVRGRDWEKAAVSMATFYDLAGGREFARRLLLLGSGYLSQSLGHSVSCTAFILLEMLERQDQDVWPALSTLADYFCKGEFYATPPLRKTPPVPSNEIFDQHFLRATSGRGIVNLHHTITIYSMERVRHFFNEEEYNHMIGSWISFMENKKSNIAVLDSPKKEPEVGYTGFYEAFSRLEVKSVLASISERITSSQGRTEVGRFLTKSLCDYYKGNYNPHYLTGLGSALWVMDRYWKQPSIAMNAFYQYIDFLFDSLKAED